MILRSEKQGNQLNIEVSPEISYGRGTDFLRVKFRRSGKDEILDIPVQIQIESDLQFIPTSMTLMENNAGGLHGRVRVLDLKHLLAADVHITILDENCEPIDTPEAVQIKFEPSEKGLHTLELRAVKHLLTSSIRGVLIAGKQETFRCEVSYAVDFNAD